MEPTEVLQSYFSTKTGFLTQAVKLQAGYAHVTDRFGRFARNVDECGADPQFFREIVKVDLAALDQHLVTLTVFGVDQLRLCLDVIRREDEVRGQVTCYFIHGYQRAQPDQQVQPTEIARWTFGEDGMTDIKLGASRDLLDMREPKHAVAVVVVLILVAYAAPV